MAEQQGEETDVVESHVTIVEIAVDTSKWDYHFVDRASDLVSVIKRMNEELDPIGVTVTEADPS